MPDERDFGIPEALIDALERERLETLERDSEPELEVPLPLVTPRRPDVATIRPPSLRSGRYVLVNDEGIPVDTFRALR